MDLSYLKLENVSKSYDQGKSVVSVLKNVTFLFKQKSSYAITGVSGSGKSTLLHILAGLDEPTSGHVYYNGHAIESFSPTEKDNFRNQKIGLVFQFPYLIRELTALENVMVKGLLNSKSSNEVKNQAMKLLDLVGLAEKKDNFPGQLSGGQQQRVAIARALMNHPDFLLADEPTGSLDVHTGNEIMKLLLDLQEKEQMGLIICSHEEYVYQKMEMVLELKDGILKTFS